MILFLLENFIVVMLADGVYAVMAERWLCGWAYDETFFHFFGEELVD